MSKGPEAVVLVGERIALEPVSDDYLNDFCEYSLMSEFYEFIEYEPFSERDQAKDYLANMIRKSVDEGNQYWFVCLRTSKKAIGTFCAINHDAAREIVEIGYGLSPRYWGSGYFDEVLDVALPYIFDVMGVHRVFAKTMITNAASIKGLRRKRFVQEGMLRDFYRYVADGRRVDAALLSLLRHEYQR